MSAVLRVGHSVTGEEGGGGESKSFSLVVDSSCGVILWPDIEIVAGKRTGNKEYRTEQKPKIIFLVCAACLSACTSVGWWWLPSLLFVGAGVSLAVRRQPS